MRLLVRVTTENMATNDISQLVANYAELAPTQQAAAETFWMIAAEFKDSAHLLRLLDFFAAHPAAAGDVAPITPEPDRTAALLDAWLALDQSNAMTAIEFKPDVEEALSADPRLQELQRQRSVIRPGTLTYPDQFTAACAMELNRRAVLRIRAAAFAGHLATQEAQRPRRQSANEDLRPAS